MPNMWMYVSSDSDGWVRVYASLVAVSTAWNLKHLIQKVYFGDVSTAYFRIISDGHMSSEKKKQIKSSRKKQK